MSFLNHFLVVGVIQICEIKYIGSLQGGKYHSNFRKTCMCNERGRKIIIQILEKLVCVMNADEKYYTNSFKFQENLYV